MKETKLKEIAGSGMDKQDMFCKYDCTKDDYAKVLIHRKIKKYADALARPYSVPSEISQSVV